MGISIWQLLIIALIVVLLFGTKKLRNIGGDLGSALKSFKKAVREDEIEEASGADLNKGRVIDAKEPSDHKVS